jgi:CBS domain-containing protein
MNIGSICKRRLVTVDANGSLQQAATLMREHHICALVIIDGGKDGAGPRVVGIVTDVDMAIEVLARGGDASQAKTGLLAQGRVVSVSMWVSIVSTRACRPAWPKCAAGDCKKRRGSAVPGATRPHHRTRRA